ncbi:MAG: hypothetical protein QF886_14780 [Planctomycetota bacterium]|nr:hypothetical protein [Planctomycetota bacterium]
MSVAAELRRSSDSIRRRFAVRRYRFERNLWMSCSQEAEHEGKTDAGSRLELKQHSAPEV